MMSNDTRSIRLLGTGAADWMEDHECSDTCRLRCARINALGGKNKRRFCSMFIGPDTLVDFSRDTSEALHEYHIEESAIRHLIITHGHHDHFRPLDILAFAARLPHPLTVYANEAVISALDFAACNRWNLSKGNFEENDADPNLQMRIVGPGQSFAVGDLNVTPFLANHMIDKTYSILEQMALNYVVQRDGQTLFYGLDSSFVLPRSFKALKCYRFDVAVFDATFGHLKIDQARSGHHNFAMLGETLAQFREADLFQEYAKIIASHISRCYVDPHDDIVDELAKQGITLAYDGMTIDDRM